MTPYQLTTDVLFDRFNDAATGLLFHNENAEQDITVRLPAPTPRRVFEILQLAPYSLTLHTNDENITFLRQPPSNLLIISGKPSMYGRSLTIEAYKNCWRIIRSTFNERQLTFKEINTCLDTVTTN